ncbi:MAG: alpha-ketoacid dehydrogenase subunit beta [Deltaproteobacteria bacterium]|jgi:pyruvate dehydrogenase E1 component beta subunit|nr:alpha-ketoacid dehydrogenase subunit beta [Deltaproteobacteria bacterium]
MSTLTYVEALREGMVLEMRRDPKVFLAGEDVGLFGGCFGQTQGMFAEFGPERVVDTPISETAIIGLGTGAAAAGLRPIVELMFIDFVGVAMDELFNQAAKMRYMFGGKAKVPFVARMPAGAGFSAAAQHSQSLEAWLAHIPGIKVVMPYSPADAKGLMISSIRDDNPVVYIETKTLYGLKGEVPEGEYLTPIGKAAVVREGSDVSLISWGAMVGTCLTAAEQLSKSGKEAEVVDLKTIVPFDLETVLNSVKKTGRAVIVHEAVRTAGFGAEVAAELAEKGFDSLNAPIVRVTAPNTPVPFSPPLEKEYIPSAEKVVKAALGLF